MTLQQWFESRMNESGEQKTFAAWCDAQIALDAARIAERSARKAA